jgi:hypothetical protein
MATKVIPGWKTYIALLIVAGVLVWAHLSGKIELETFLVGVLIDAAFAFMKAGANRTERKVDEALKRPNAPPRMG